MRTASKLNAAEALNFRTVLPGTRWDARKLQFLSLEQTFCVGTPKTGKRITNPGNKRLPHFLSLGLSDVSKRIDF